MEIDPEGNVVNHRIYPSVMKSAARMTYTDVNKILKLTMTPLVNAMNA